MYKITPKYKGFSEIPSPRLVPPIFFSGILETTEQSSETIELEQNDKILKELNR